jgi:hypothetical protein
MSKFIPLKVGISIHTKFVARFKIVPALTGAYPEGRENEYSTIT